MLRIQHAGMGHQWERLYAPLARRKYEYGSFRIAACGQQNHVAKTTFHCLNTPYPRGVLLFPLNGGCQKIYSGSRTAS